MLNKIPTPLLYCIIGLALLANIAFDSIFYTLSAMIDSAAILVAGFAFWAVQKKLKEKKGAYHKDRR